MLGGAQVVGALGALAFGCSSFALEADEGVSQEEQHQPRRHGVDDRVDDEPEGVVGGLGVEVLAFGDGPDPVHGLVVARLGRHHRTGGPREAGTQLEQACPPGRVFLELVPFDQVPALGRLVELLPLRGGAEGSVDLFRNRRPPFNIARRCVQRIERASGAEGEDGDGGVGFLVRDREVDPNTEPQEHQKGDDRERGWMSEAFHRWSLCAHWCWLRLAQVGVAALGADGEVFDLVVAVIAQAQLYAPLASSVDDTDYLSAGEHDHQPRGEGVDDGVDDEAEGVVRDVGAVHAAILHRPGHLHKAASSGMNIFGCPRDQREAGSGFAEPCRLSKGSVVNPLNLIVRVRDGGASAPACWRASLFKDFIGDGGPADRGDRRLGVVRRPSEETKVHPGDVHVEPHAQGEEDQQGHDRKAGWFVEVHA